MVKEKKIIYVCLHVLNHQKTVFCTIELILCCFPFNIWHKKKNIWTITLEALIKIFCFLTQKNVLLSPYCRYVLYIYVLWIYHNIHVSDCVHVMCLWLFLCANALIISELKDSLAQSKSQHFFWFFCVQFSVTFSQVSLKPPVFIILCVIQTFSQQLSHYLV